MQAVLARFPGAEIVGVRKASDAAPPGPQQDAELQPPPDDAAADGADWLMDETGETDQDA